MYKGPFWLQPYGSDVTGVWPAPGRGAQQRVTRSAVRWANICVFVLVWSYMPIIIWIPIIGWMTIIYP